VKVLVVGGGAGGMAAASRAKRLMPDADVTVVEKSNWVSFALCGIPYLAGCTIKRLDQLLHYKLEVFTKKRGINILLQHEVVDVDVSARTARIVDLRNGKETTLEWDKLVIATGARSRATSIWPEIEEMDNVFYIKHIDTGDAIRRYALRPGVEKAVIVGSGYVGMEMAENLVALGLKVTIVEAMDTIVPNALDPEISRDLQAHIESKGVKVITGSPVREFRGDKGRASSIVTDNGEIEGDIFIVGVGIEPNTALARAMGLRIGETGAVWTDDKMMTSAEDVFAVGDVAEHKDLVTGRRVWRPFAQIANKMGYVAGSVIGGREASFPGSVGTSAFKVFDLAVARTGLTRREAEAAGFKPVEVELAGSTKPHYMPGGSEIKLKVVADEDTGRILGGQALGDDSAFWRVNVLAGLITAGATVWDLFFTDLGYAPPLSPVWDPLVVAARLLMRKLGEKPRY